MTAMLGVALNLILGLSRAGDGGGRGDLPRILARYLARREECYCPLAALSGPTRWALLRSATDPNRTLAERFHEKLRRKTNAHFLFAQCNKLDPKLLRRERLCGMAFLQGALVTVSCYLPPARAIDLT